MTTPLAPWWRMVQNPPGRPAVAYTPLFVAGVGVCRSGVGNRGKGWPEGLPYLALRSRSGAGGAGGLLARLFAEHLQCRRRAAGHQGRPGRGGGGAPGGCAASGATGAVVGGAAGGIAGSQIGNGTTSAFGALGGSPVGGLIGIGAEHAAGDTTAYEYVVRKTNRDLVSVTQKGDPPLAIGEHVLVIAGAQARIVPDYTVSLTPEKPEKPETAETARVAAQPLPPPDAAAAATPSSAPAVQPSVPVTGAATAFARPRWQNRCRPPVPPAGRRRPLRQPRPTCRRRR